MTDPRVSSLLRQIFVDFPILGSHGWPVVYTGRVGSVAATTTVSPTPSVRIASKSEIAAICFGQWDTNGIYQKNNSRWAPYFDQKHYIFGEAIGSTSTVIGASDILMGSKLDRFLNLQPPRLISGGEVVNVDLRNEGSSALYHDFGLFTTTDFPGESGTPIPEDLDLSSLELRVGTMRFASVGATPSSPLEFPFVAEGGAWVVGFLGHREASGGAITDTAVEVKIYDSENRNYTTPGSWTLDQLLFGANGQRPFILPDPLYYHKNSAVLAEINNDIATTPPTLNYELSVLYIARK